MTISNRDEQIEQLLRAAAKILEDDYGHGVDNGYWPTVAPTLKKIRKVLERRNDTEDNQ